jgi:hypothetical protein
MWFDGTNYRGKMVLTLAIFRHLIALKGLWKVFDNRQKKSLKVFEIFWSWRLRTLSYECSECMFLHLSICNSSTPSHPSEDENRTRNRSKSYKCKRAFRLECARWECSCKAGYRRASFLWEVFMWQVLFAKCTCVYATNFIWQVFIWQVLFTGVNVSTSLLWQFNEVT